MIKNISVKGYNSKNKARTINFQLSKDGLIIISLGKLKIMITDFNKNFKPALLQMIKIWVYKKKCFVCGRNWELPKHSEPALTDPLEPEDLFDIFEQDLTHIPKRLIVSKYNKKVLPKEPSVLQEPVPQIVSEKKIEPLDCGELDVLKFSYDLEIPVECTLFQTMPADLQGFHNALCKYGCKNDK